MIYYKTFQPSTAIQQKKLICVAQEFLDGSSCVGCVG